MRYIILFMLLVACENKASDTMQCASDGTTIHIKFPVKRAKETYCSLGLEGDEKVMVICGAKYLGVCRIPK